MIHTTETGQVLTGVHSPLACAGRACCIHNPSDHPLRSAPRRFQSPGYTMLRICKHGVEHPDPDHIDFITERFGEEVAEMQATHACCGCCTA